MLLREIWILSCGDVTANVTQIKAVRTEIRFGQAAVWKTAASRPNSAIVAISENEISGQRQRPGSSVASAAP